MSSSFVPTLWASPSCSKTYSPQDSGRPQNTDPAPETKTPPSTESLSAEDSFPVLVSTPLRALWMSSFGEVDEDGPEKLYRNHQKTLREFPPLVCHAPSVFANLHPPKKGLPPKESRFPCLDVLELFAFVHPAQPLCPTLGGLCRFLKHPSAEKENALSLEEQAFALTDCAFTLLEHLRLALLKAAPTERDTLFQSLALLYEGGWSWAKEIQKRLPFHESHWQSRYQALDVWKRRKEWEERKVPPPKGSTPISPVETWKTLATLLPTQAEQRPEQVAYSLALSEGFNPSAHSIPTSSPFPLTGSTSNIILAEAGTGVGKTLGYIAPASLWAQKNQRPVWLATFTKNLQRQLDQELDHLYPDPKEKERFVAVYKGRENYLCLLNFQEASLRTRLNPALLIPLTLMSRWIDNTKEGDLHSSDLPGWLPDLLGHSATTGLSDRRGECLYTACEHYKHCFIEQAVRKTQSARLVIANHALVMTSLFLNRVGAHGSDLENFPQHFIFDEGHHLFDAADSAFSAILSGQEGQELRRWFLGIEAGRRTGKKRGLKGRLEDLLDLEPTLHDPLRKVLTAAHILPGPGWLKRQEDGQPYGAFETFLFSIRLQLEKAVDPNVFYSIEEDPFPLEPKTLETLKPFLTKLAELETPLKDLHKRLCSWLTSGIPELDQKNRQKLEGLCATLERRTLYPILQWRRMCQDLLERENNALDKKEQDPSLTKEARKEETPIEDTFIDSFCLERRGKILDVLFIRQALDPAKLFMQTLEENTSTGIITSATLRSGAQRRDPQPSLELLDSSEQEDREQKSETSPSKLPHTGTAEDLSSWAVSLSDATEESWIHAKQLTGAQHLQTPALCLAYPSPFDYAQNSRVFIVNDIDKKNLFAQAQAYSALFKASQGSALGLFTAISRLRAAHPNILRSLAEENIPLYAQHVDQMNITSLLHAFKEEKQACLLGTDAVRDGVDVPGDSLRLLVFDRVPWPRATRAQKKRRTYFGGRAYDEALVRMKIHQAFGRLIRRQDDKGVFVLLDSAFPSRFENAFPKDTPIKRLSLAETLEQTKSFLD